MIVISGPRGVGKTAELARLAVANNAWLVVRLASEAKRVNEMAKRLGLKGLRYPLTFDQFVEGRYSPQDCTGFMVDEVDLLVARMSRGVPVTAVTTDAPCTFRELSVPKRDWKPLPLTSGELVEENNRDSTFISSDERVTESRRFVVSKAVVQHNKSNK